MIWIVCCQTYRFRNFVWIFREWWDPQLYFMYPNDYCEGLQTLSDLSTFDLTHGMCIWSVPCLLLYTHVNIMRNCMYISPLWDHTTLHCPWSTHVAEILSYIMMLFDGSLVPRPSHHPFLITCSSFCILQAIENWAVGRPGNEPNLME